MEIIAYVSDTAIGTAQVLTFALPVGVFGGVIFWGFFQRPAVRRRSQRRRRGQDQR